MTGSHDGQGERLLERLNHQLRFTRKIVNAIPARHQSHAAFIVMLPVENPCE